MAGKMRLKPGVKIVQAIPEDLPVNADVIVMGKSTFYTVQINGKRYLVNENYIENPTNEEADGKVEPGQGLSLKK
jgi:hypothetical protein